jgi:hypothetical protein
MKRLALAASMALAFAVAPVALAAGGLSGTYKTTIASPAPIKGKWKVTFTPGAYTVSDNGNLVVKGIDAIAGRAITLMDKSGPGACKKPGKYTFAVTGKKLKFTKISDTCNGRPGVLSHTYHKV